jgi:hypothetical protein
MLGHRRLKYFWAFPFNALGLRSRLPRTGQLVVSDREEFCGSFRKRETEFSYAR